MKREHITSPLLPSGYRQLEYLESTGTQYINTSWSIDNNNIIMSIDTVFSYTEYQQGASVFGAQYNSNGLCITPFLWLQANIYGRALYVLCGGSDRIFEICSSNYSDWGSINTFSFIADNGQWSSSFNSSTSSGSYIKKFPLNKNFYLFCSNHDYRADQFAKIRLYNFKITKNNIEVRYYLPALRIADSKPGLYDLVNNQFYTNAGTGEFLYN